MAEAGPQTYVKASNMKDILKDNREIGKLSKSIPVICASVCDEFIKDLVRDSINKENTNVTLEGLIEAISKNKKYDFLYPLLPKFKEQVEEKASKNKK